MAEQPEAVEEDHEFGPTVTRRNIGRRCRMLRDRLKMSPAEAAKRIGMSRGWLDNLENGADGVKLVEPIVRHMMDVYDAPDQERDLILELAADARRRIKPWWHDKTEASLPSWLRLYLALEEDAEFIRQYEPELIPGLLQTEAYAARIMAFEEYRLGAAECARRVGVRMKRQEYLLTRPLAPRLEVVLNEVALLRVAHEGGTFARDQLQQLLDAVAKSNTVLRILPLAAGIHAGMASSAGFSLLQFPIDKRTGEPIEPSGAYLDTPVGSMYHEKPEAVGIYFKLWEDLMLKTLDPKASRQLIMTNLAGLPQ